MDGQDAPGNAIPSANAHERPRRSALTDAQARQIDPRRRRPARSRPPVPADRVEAGAQFPGLEEPEPVSGHIQEQKILITNLSERVLKLEFAIKP